MTADFKFAGTTYPIGRKRFNSMIMFSHSAHLSRVRDRKGGIDE